MAIPASTTIPATTSKFIQDVEVTSLLTAMRAVLSLLFGGSSGQILAQTGWAGDTAWTAVTFTNSWANSGGTNATAAFRKDADGWVHVKGIITGGAAGNSIFTLPVGYRPLEIHQFAQHNYNGASNIYGEITVNPAGTVVPAIYSAGNMSIDCVFLGEQ